jgi:hypothetical protein
VKFCLKVVSEFSADCHRPSPGSFHARKTLHSFEDAEVAAGQSTNDHRQDGRCCREASPTILQETHFDSEARASAPRLLNNSCGGAQNIMRAGTRPGYLQLKKIPGSRPVCEPRANRPAQTIECPSSVESGNKFEAHPVGTSAGDAISNFPDQRC